MTETKHEYRGLAYTMTEISGQYQYYIPYRKFTSEWHTVANSGDLTPEQAAHKAARWLIDVYL